MSTGGAPGRAQAERLSLAVLRTLQAPADDAATLEAVAVVERVRSGPAHADVPEAIGAHADLVLRLRPQADGWLRQILDAPAQAKLPALRAEVLRLTILAETRTARYRDGLVLVALVLAGYIALQVREMRRLEAARRAQELELIESSRMSMLGLLSAGVAHDIRRFSQVVAIGASFLADAFRDAVQALQRKGAGEPSPELAGLPYGEARDAVDAQARNLLDAADAARRMAEDVLKFSRPDEPTTRDRGDLFHPNESVERIARLLRDHFHRAGARLELDLDRALPAARGGAHVFEQALVNLVSNALEALPGPGRTVRVRTHARPLGTGITITVEDEGRGMAPGELARLGEAFFTTRRGRGGTGLGVTIAFSKVARLGGTMRFASTVGQGTTVTIELACADARGRDVPGGTLDA
jgi:signal transduction histidine kinase